AITLARRAANTLALAQDAILFQGLNAFAAAAAPPLGSTLFATGTVQSRGIPLDSGLLCTGGANVLPAAQVRQVTQLGAAGAPPVWSTNTVAQITSAFAALAGNGYGGPYVAVLNFYPFADTLAPLAATLILPADRIKPLMEAGYYSSS